MISIEDRSRSLVVYISLFALALLAAGILMMIMARGLTLSIIRILLIAGVFLLAVIGAGLVVKLRINSARRVAIYRALANSNTASRLTIIMGVFFAVFWCLTWLPVEQTSRIYYYYIGTYPLILFGMLASGSSLIFLITERDDFSWAVWNKYWQELKLVLIVALIGLMGFGFIVFLTIQFKVLIGTDPYWYGAGVPLLAWQVFVTVIVAIITLRVESKLFNIKGRIVFLFVWMVAAFFWVRQPVNQSFWITPRVPPNFENYPFSDLVVFDMGSQFALIGQGINNHLFFDRALYMSFLVYLHIIGGQEYQHLMALQAAVFAVFPALIYLIGEKLHSRIAGIILAALATFRGLNSLIATTWIYTSTFKHMLTDFPTAIGLAVFTILILLWLERPGPRWYDAGWAAGTLGLTSLVRPNVLLLLPVLLLAVFWVYRSAWKKSLILVGLTCMAFLVSVSPWVLFGSANGSIIELYRSRIEDVIRKRYVPDAFIPAHAARVLAGGSKLEMLMPASRARILNNNPSIPFPIRYFLHNLVTSSINFPDSPEFLGVQATVKGGEAFWSSYWNGDMSSTAAGMLVLNLAIVSIGFGAAFRRIRWYGLVPLAVFLIYQAANGLARTSGGRYLVPVDWILFVYFGIGIAELLRVGGTILGREPIHYSSNYSTNLEGREEIRLVWLRTAGVLLGLAIIGGMIPLAGYLYPPRYIAAKPSVLLDEIAPYFPTLGLNRTDVENFLLKPQAIIIEGRALYPRYYPQDKGELNPIKPFKNFGYSRTEFILIGPHGLDYVILPGGQPDTFPNADDVILLGCQITTETYNAANALVVVIPDKAAGYVRSPAAPLTCPLPEPVCDNNKICH